MPRSPSCRPAATASRGQIEVIVPLRGLQMPVTRLDLATASIVRADTVDVPSEARTGEGLGVSPWEPAFLAVVRVEEPGRGGGEDARRSRVRRRRSVPSADHHPEAVQGRRRRPRPPRMDAHRRRSLAADRDGRGTPAPGRLPAGRHRARQLRGALPRPVRVREPVRSPGCGASGLPRDARPLARAVRGRPRAQRRHRGAQRPPAGASVRARGRWARGPGTVDAGGGAMRRARPPRPGKGGRRSRHRPRA